MGESDFIELLGGEGWGDHRGWEVTKLTNSEALWERRESLEVRICMRMDMADRAPALKAAWASRTRFESWVERLVS